MSDSPSPRIHPRRLLTGCAQERWSASAWASAAALPILILFIASGCGGGSSGGSAPAPPPPPAGDFVIRVTPSVSVQQGGLGASLGVSVDSVNGFNSPVAVSVEGVPAGVTVSPAQLSIPPNQSQAFVLTASTGAGVSTTTVTVRGTAASLSHSVTSSLSITAKAPFHLMLSPSSATLARGANASSQIQLVVDFGSLSQAMLSFVANPTTGVTGVSYGISSVVITPGQPVTLSISTFALGDPLSNYSIGLIAQQGQDTAVATFSLNVTVPFPTSSAPTRSTFLRTDEAVNGIVYDSTRKLVFATVHDLNKVEVLSSVDGRRVATIPVTRPSSVDLAPDSRHVYVGSRTSIISVIDADLLQVVQRIFVNETPNDPLPRPVLLAALSNGTVFLLELSGTLVQWNPSTGIFTDRRIILQGLTPQAMWRSRDGSKLLVGAGHSAGGFVSLYNTATDSFTPAVSIPSLSSREQIALNPDGTRIALLTGQQVILYDDQLQEVRQASSASLSPQGVLFSRDGRFLYIRQQVSASAAGLTILDAQTLSVVGVLPSLIGDFFGSVPSDVDETGMIFAASDLQGLALVHAALPRALSLKVPQMRLPNTMDPPQGDASSPAPTTVNGVGFISGAQVFFGAPPASALATPGTNVSVTSTNVIQVTPPRAPASGAVNVTVVHPDGWYSIAPDGYTYGTQVLFVSPNVGAPEGGASITIFGYGFGFTAGQIQVTIGGQPAKITDLVPGPGISPFAFPIHHVTVTTPSGSPGPADLTISTPAGRTTVPGGFTYLKRAKVFPVSDSIGQVIYDQRRNRLYATNFRDNRVEVFDLVNEQFLSPIPVGKSPAGLALTPDGSRLVVANFHDNTVNVIDPGNPGTPASVATGLEPGCGPAPTLVAGAKQHHAVIQIACLSTAGNGVLRVLDTSTSPPSFTCSGLTGCDALVARGATTLAGTLDGSKVVAGDGSVDAGPAYLWDPNAGTFLQKGLGFTLGDAAAAADGNLLIFSFSILGPDLRVLFVPQDVRFLRAAAASSADDGRRYFRRAPRAPGRADRNA